MGGGGNSRDRREEDRLAAEREAQRVAANQAIVVAQTPPRLESFISEEDEALLRQASGQEGPVDVRNLRGMGTGLALYNNAVKDADSERMGIGALRFGADEAGGYTDLLRENQREHRQRDAAGQLESTVNQRIAQARGEAFPLINISQDRNMGIAGMRTGMYENAANRSQQFLMRPRQPSFWQTLLQTGLGAAGQVGAAYMGRP